LINYYNRAATQLSGRTPVLGSDRWCVSWRLYHPDGTPLLHENCPMTVALQENRPINGAEILVERPDGTRAPVMVYPAPLRDPDGELAGGINTLIDITERKRDEEHLKLLIDELNHRVKNTLSIVQSLAQQTFRSEMDYDDVRGAFEGRLSALAAAHDLLTRRNWEATDLADLARTLFEAFSVDSERALIEGPEVRLEPKTTISIAMALHELVTNAAKYGALSTENGRVSLKWQILNVETPRLAVCWQESGGPPVKPPERRGFGSRMIERALAYELGGTAELEFRPEGLVCRIDAPLPQTRAERWPS
jgi:PAS domain S-box-containing protein